MAKWKDKTFKQKTQEISNFPEWQYPIARWIAEKTGDAVETVGAWVNDHFSSVGAGEDIGIGIEQIIGEESEPTPAEMRELAAQWEIYKSTEGEGRRVIDAPGRSGPGSISSAPGLKNFGRDPAFELQRDPGRDSGAEIFASDSAGPRSTTEVLPPLGDIRPEGLEGPPELEQSSIAPPASPTAVMEREPMDIPQVEAGGIGTADMSGAFEMPDVTGGSIREPAGDTMFGDRVDRNRIITSNDPLARKFVDAVSILMPGGPINNNIDTILNEYGYIDAQVPIEALEQIISVAERAKRNNSL